MKPLSFFFAALPFAFALFRAVRTGSDFRYFWVALAASAGAAAIVRFTKRFPRGPRLAVGLAAVVFVGATLVALLAAMLLGTTLGLGILVVAASFGFCFAAGAGLRVAGR
jgi:hypothetical protein